MKTLMTKPVNVVGAKSLKPFEEAVALTNYGKFNFYLIMATGGALACVIIESMGAMFIIPSAQCDLNLTLAEKGLLFSINFLGVVSSSYIWGYIADTRGRKIVIIVSLFVSAILSLICSFVTVSWLFILLRYANGFFVGGSSAITYAYAGEFHDASRRSNVVAWIASSVAWGAVFIPSLAWLVLGVAPNWSFEIPYLDIVYKPWRLLMLIYIIPSIIYGIMVLFLPESPKYLLMEGKKEEVLEILKTMYSVNTGNSKDTYPVSEVYWDEETLQDKKKIGFLMSLWRQTSPLFTREHFVKTILICFLQFSIFFLNNSVMMWYPDILNSMSMYGKIVPDSDVTMCKSLLYVEDSTNRTIYLPRAITSEVCVDTIEDTAFMMPVIIGVCYVCVYIPIATVIHKVGARNLLYGFMTVTVIGGICAQLISGYTYVQVALGVFLMNGPGISIVNAINVEIYPTQIRGMALAISLMFGRIGAMTGSNVLGPLIASFCDYLFYTFAVIQVAVVLVTLVLPKPRPFINVAAVKDFS